MVKRAVTSSVGMAAALSMALAVSSASANRLSISHTAIRAMWANVKFLAGGAIGSECPLTLAGSFHSGTISKVPRALIGYVSSAVTSTCALGGLTVLVETLPWHLQYVGFTGALPRVGAVRTRLIGASLRLRDPFLGTCLMRTTTERPAVLAFEGISWDAGGNGLVSEVITDPTARIPCGAFAIEVAGTASLLESAGGRNVLLRLI
jgi:hypothetical protein